MTDLQKQDYSNIRTFMIMSSYANIDLWTEDLFEKLYTRFCNEYFNSNWKHITKEEFNFVIDAAKKVHELQSQVYEKVANGADENTTISCTSEQLAALKSLVIKNISIDDTSNTILKFFTWCYKLKKI